MHVDAVGVFFLQPRQRHDVFPDLVRTHAGMRIPQERPVIGKPDAFKALGDRRDDIIVVGHVLRVTAAVGVDVERRARTEKGGCVYFFYHMISCFCFALCVLRVAT